MSSSSAQRFSATPYTAQTAQPTIKLPADAAISLIASIASLLVLVLCEAAATSPLMPLCGVLFAHLVCLIFIRNTIGDPIVIFELVLFQYSYFPQIITPNSDRFMRLFRLDGAYYIYSFAIVFFLFSLFIAQFALRAQKETTSDEADNSGHYPLLRRAAALGANASLVLSAVYAAQHGIVISGSVQYAESFADRMTTGSGFLLLSVPLAIAALSSSILTERRLINIQNAYALLPFVALFFVHGQRKYIIIPTLILTARYFRVRSARGLIIITFSTFLLYFSFIYLGFARTYNIPYDEYFSSRTISRFLAELPNIVGGEAPPIFATASAAFYGFVAPLPWFGDYLLSWLMAAPQFLVGGIFESFNTRFAFALDPVTASLGYGWGFSFWGEAYAVGGLAMMICAALMVTLSLQLILINSRRMGQNNYLWHIILYSGLYYSLWIQRNAFAYTLREFIVYQVGIIFFLLFIARISMRFGSHPPKVSSSPQHGSPSANPSPPRPLPR